jgi:hypothetical protein
VVADSHYFKDEQDPDPHSSEKLYPDPHSSDSDPQPCPHLKPVFRIRLTFFDEIDAVSLCL